MWVSVVVLVRMFRADLLWDEKPYLLLSVSERVRSGDSDLDCSEVLSYLRGTWADSLVLAGV